MKRRRRHLLGTIAADHLSKTVRFGEGLVRHVLELGRDGVGAPSCGVVLDQRGAEMGGHGVLRLHYSNAVNTQQSQISNLKSEVLLKRR